MPDPDAVLTRCSMYSRGETVISTAGRDKTEVLAVVAADETHVFVCNGKDRPLDRPKRKNPKHIRPAGAALDETQMRSDRSLRRALAIVKTNMNLKERC